MNDESKESLLEFPCEFPIKMMGRISDGFREMAVVLVEKHAGKIAEEAITVTPSRKGNFVSVTVTIVAESQQQLDSIYRDLTRHAEILVAL
jgi:putative lipoic acid-binding regulatory protein